MAIRGGRPDDRRIVPYLFVRNAEKAIEFYKQAFGARTLYRSPMPGGNGIFAQLQIFDSVVQLADESPEPRDPSGPTSPQTRGGPSVILELYVDDVDAAFQRAVLAGGEPTMPPADMFFGDRYGWVTDPFGHIWALATVKQTLTAEEIEGRMGEMLRQMQDAR